MAFDEIWHRTFLPDGPYECVNCHTPNPPKQPEYVDSGLIKTSPKDRWSNDFQAVTPNPAPPAEPYNATQPRYKAFKFTGTAIVDIYIVGKLGQDFADYATDWERKFSILAGGSDAIPVVDHSLTVVGHVMRSDDASVYIGGVKGHVTTSRDGFGNNPHKDFIYEASYADLKQLLEDEYPMYMDDKPPPGPWFRFVQTLSPGTNFSIFTAVDGEALLFFGASSKPGAEAEDSPWDYILLVKELVMLGAKIGSKLILYAARKARKKIEQRIIRGAERRIAERAAAEAASREVAGAKSFIPQSGMTPKHFSAFQAAAQEEKLIVLVRNTNPKSAALIEHGAPGKPKNLEFLKTSPDDGIVTVTKPTDLYEVYDKGYAVVGNDSVARRLVKGDVRAGAATYEVVELKNTFWKVKPGQVIEVKSKMPIVGDYDLMGVINPSSTGANLALVVQDGKVLTDWTNPMTQRFSRNVNNRMGAPDRVLHGAQDAYGGFRGGATGFFPDGTVRFFETEKEIIAYYESIKRQTHVGSYGKRYKPPSDGAYPPPTVHPGGKK